MTVFGLIINLKSSLTFCCFKLFKTLGISFFFFLNHKTGVDYIS